MAEANKFREQYRELTPDEKALVDAIKAKAAELDELIEKVAPGRHRSLAATSLELSVMWAIKGLTA